MVFGLTARAIEPFIEVLGAAARKIGDDKAGIGVPSGPASTRAMMRSTQLQRSSCGRHRKIA